jgi:hypothetical protein
MCFRLDRFGKKFDTKCGMTVGFPFVPNKPKEKAGLANPGVTEHNDLEGVIETVTKHLFFGWAKV